MAMPDLQRYPLKHCLINYELDIHVFVSLNCLITFVRSLQNCHIFDQIKGTVVNRTLSSLHGESLKFTRTVPLIVIIDAYSPFNCNNLRVQSL